jgi:hypothetical protein
VLDQLHKDIDRLNADELRVLRLLVDKLTLGKLKHGPLDLERDRRDWLQELLAEQLDATHYIAMAIAQIDIEQGRPQPIEAGLADLAAFDVRRGGRK